MRLFRAGWLRRLQVVAGLASVRAPNATLTYGSGAELRGAGISQSNTERRSGGRRGWAWRSPGLGRLSCGGFYSGTANIVLKALEQGQGLLLGDSYGDRGLAFGGLWGEQPKLTFDSGNADGVRVIQDRSRRSRDFCHLAPPTKDGSIDVV